MKLQKMLDSSRFSQFLDHFIDYRRFKKSISSNYSQAQEDDFVNLLGLEVDRVFAFINSRHVEYLSRVEELDYANDESCSALRDELYVFSEFVRINIICLKRILRRHDRFSGFKISPEYRRKIRERDAEVKNLVSLVTSIGEKQLSQRHSPAQECQNAGTSMPAKYWIPSENLVGLKLGILKHLPKTRYVENAGKLDDSFITTVYLDSVDLALYSSAIKDKAMPGLVRLRWLGNNLSDISCEIVRNGPGGTSVDGFKITEKAILDFLNGNDIWHDVKQINSEDRRPVYKEIQKAVRDMRLRPVLRTFFRRCIFESTDGALRLCLDSNIAMIRECSSVEFESDPFPLKRWRRSDVSGDWPFRGLPASEIVRFPHTILKVNGSGSHGWMENLLSQSNIEHVPGFSKFLHGSAILYPTSDLMPFWLPQTVLRPSPGTVAPRSKMNDDLMVQGESEISYELSPASEHRTRIAIPIRVEPKAFFANERTFLSWIQFAVFLGGIGTAMVGLGNMHAYLCGVMLIGVAGVFAFYSLYLFHYRANRIRVKDPGPYEDLVGPTILVGIFILVMALSFVFKFPIKKNGLK